MVSKATASTVDFDDSWMDAEWDLLQSEDVYEVQVAEVQDIYHELVVCNRLLGILDAAVIIAMIWALVKFFVRLVTRNITNYF